MKILLVAAVLGMPLAAHAADPPVGTPVSFLACPVARDTGSDTDLCFFAEHDGVRYALTNPPDWGTPQLKHRVLVEGRVKEGPDYCGALTIDGRASVMPEVDPGCATVMPFDGLIKGVTGGVFNSGSPQQRAYAQDLARRAAENPALSIEPAILDPAPTPPPQPPFTPRSLTIVFPFDSDRGSGPDMLKLKDLAVYAAAAQVKRVQVVGFRAASRLDDGGELVEKPQLAQARAEKIGGILRALGVPSAALDIRWEAAVADPVGIDDWRKRRVEITASP